MLCSSVTGGFTVSVTSQTRVVKYLSAVIILLLQNIFHISKYFILNVLMYWYFIISRFYALICMFVRCKKVMSYVSTG